MKRSLILFVSLLLASSSTALAEDGLARRLDQDSERPRRVEISAPSLLGVELEEVTHESAQRLKLKTERGAIIEHVYPDSSAAKGGLKKDDVIVKWNSEPIESAGEVSRRIRETPAGRTVRLGVVRDGGETEATVTLGERRQFISSLRVAPAVAARPVRPPREAWARVGERYRMGVSVQGMSPQLAEYFGLTGRNGALVVYVYPDSPAGKAGLKAGDVILAIAGETTENPQKVREILRSKSEGPIELRVLRDKQERTFTLQLEKGKTSWLVSPDDFDLPEPAEPVIHIAPIPRVALGPLHLPKVVVNVEPLTNLEVVPALPPITIPEITIPKISIPPMAIPPVRVVVPYRLRITV
ncbi:MAG TPA: PDZ domain-containing protein [Blastocatellia bacterium]|nr:PDZ domain-containing protein [Blastocatellia bacterium]